MTYQYDELSRLVQETRPGAASVPVTSTYQYDGVGNRQQMLTYLPPNTKAGVGTMVLTTTYGYNAADQMNTRSEVGPNGSAINGFTYNYQYDANGSLLSETNTATGGEITSYSYDTRNRLTQVQKQAKGQNLSTTTM